MHGRHRIVSLIEFIEHGKQFQKLKELNLKALEKAQSELKLFSNRFELPADDIQPGVGREVVLNDRNFETLLSLNFRQIRDLLGLEITQTKKDIKDLKAVSVLEPFEEISGYSKLSVTKIEGNLGLRVRFPEFISEEDARELNTETVARVKEYAHDQLSVNKQKIGHFAFRVDQKHKHRSPMRYTWKKDLLEHEQVTRGALAALTALFKSGAQQRIRSDLLKNILFKIIFQYEPRLEIDYTSIRARLVEQKAKQLFSAANTTREMAIKRILGAFYSIRTMRAKIAFDAANNAIPYIPLAHMTEQAESCTPEKYVRSLVEAKDQVGKMIMRFEPHCRFKRTRKAIAQMLRTMGEVPKNEYVLRFIEEENFSDAVEADTSLLAELSAREKRLEQVLRMADGPYEDPLEFFLLRKTYEEYRRAMKQISDFSAFPGARTVPNMPSLLARTDLLPVGLGVSQQAPELLAGNIQQLDLPIVALGQDGTLCVRDYKPGGRDVLRLYNFILQKDYALAVPELRWACVFQGELFVGVRREKKIFYENLENVFKDRASFENFKSFDVQHEIWSAALDRAHEGWIVFLTSSFVSDTIVRVDLERKTHRAIKCRGRRFRSIGGLTGIHIPRVLCAALGGDRPNKTYAVFDDGSSVEIAQYLEGFPVILPSAQNPADLASAAVLDYEARVEYRGNCAVLETPVRPDWLSLVRLYQDIFLCIDSEKQKWRAVRIVVP